MPWFNVTFNIIYNFFHPLLSFTCFCLSHFPFTPSCLNQKFIRFPPLILISPRPRSLAYSVCQKRHVRCTRSWKAWNIYPYHSRHRAELSAARNAFRETEVKAPVSVKESPGDEIIRACVLREQMYCLLILTLSAASDSSAISSLDVKGQWWTEMFCNLSPWNRARTDCSSKQKQTNDQMFLACGCNALLLCIILRETLTCFLAER